MNSFYLDLLTLLLPIAVWRLKLARERCKLEDELRRIERLNDVCRYQPHIAATLTMDDMFHPSPF
jgi:hypothetical protein